MRAKKYDVTNNFTRSIRLTDGLGRRIRIGAKKKVTMTLPLLNIPKLLLWRRSGMVTITPYVAPPPQPPVTA